MEGSDSSSENASVEIVDDTSSDEENDGGINRLSGGPNSTADALLELSQASKENEASTSSAFGKSKIIGRNLQLEPEVGMVFHSEDQAYLFYNRYAHRKGFSVRKGHLGRRNDGSIRNRVFLCSNEGTRQKHRTHMTKKPREIVRTNCMARIEYKVSREGIWVVSKIIYEHNHPLVRLHKSHLLRSHRRLSAQHDEMNMAAEKPAEAFEFPLEEVREAEAVGFLLKDQSSYLHTTRMRELEKGDAQLLLEFLKSKQLEDPSFFYAIQLDDKEQVTNFFWADARSIIDYSYFGDVVLLDTTYRLNKSELPFAPLLGINHHKQIVVFGVALLLDETTESFVWLCKTFMVVMSGKQPKTIFTDNFAALSRAISMTLPESCHRICLWHILQNAVVHVSHLSSDLNFQKDFKNWIFGCGSDENFQSGWVDMINKYDLVSNAWLQDLSVIRDKWALVYQKNSFCASMATLRWSENMKNYFKKHFNRKLTLSKFIEQYRKTLLRFREKELYEDYKSRQTKPVLLVDMPMLNIAADSYTRLIYSEFEDEFKSQLSCLCEPLAMNGSMYTFKVSLPDKRFCGIVEFNLASLFVACSCKKFEATGILCMHALKVLNNNNVLHLPSQYILKRWTKYANIEVLPQKNCLMADAGSRDSLALQYGRVWRKAISIAVKSAFSEDSLRIFENELDKLMAEVEHVLHTAPLNRQTDDEDAANVDVMKQNALDGSKKKRGRKPKGGNEKKKEKEAVSGSIVSITCHQSLHDVENMRQNDPSDRVLLNDASNISSYHRNGGSSYCNSLPMQTSGCSFCQEAVIHTEEPFVRSQGIFDHAMVSQASSNPNITWCSTRGSFGVPLPVMDGQPHNFVNWVVQSHAVPNASMTHNHLNQHMHRNLPSQHQSLSRKLNFDINKGINMGL